MRGSISAKLVLSYAAIIFMMAGISMSFISLFSDGYILSEAKKQLKDHADKLVVLAASQSLVSDYEMMKTFANLAERNYALAIYNKDGEYEMGVNTESVPIAIEDFSTAIRQKLTMSGANILRNGDQTYALYIRHLYNSDTKELAATLVLFMQVDRYGLDRSLFLLYIMALAFAASFAVGTALVFSQRLTSNIKKLKIRANLLAKRNFNCPVKVDSYDEIGELADSIDEMAKSIEEYDMSQKVFLQNASHELRTPLMSIRGYVEGLRDGVFTDNKEEIYDDILSQTSRLEKIIEEVMYLSKLETTKDIFNPEEVSTLQIVDEAISRVMGIVSVSSVNIVKDDIAITEIYCDADSLCTALTNLLSNCLRYAKTKVEIGVRPVANGVYFVVSDDGPGISEEDLPHIFERFYKGKNGKHGLGLAIAKAVVTTHKGTISAYNKPDGETGAVFEIYIPLK